MHSSPRIGVICISVLFLLVFYSCLHVSTVSSQGDQATENMPKLTIIPENGYVLDAGKRFSVKITNSSSGIEVEGAEVAIQNVIGSEYSYTTGSDGRAYLNAPKNKERITIIATKGGYVTSTLELEINPEQGLFEQIIASDYFIVFVALLFLISAIIFVNFKQKKSIYSRAKEISKEKTMQKYDLEKTQKPKEKSSNYGNSDDAVKIKQKSNDKIEEIRIIQSRKSKEVYPIKATDKEDLDEEEKSADWFKGTSEVKYEIDRLTGEVNEDDKDKWFEGVESLRDKLDEKMKKKGKKNNDEKED